MKRAFFLFISFFWVVLPTNYQAEANTILTCEVIRTKGDHEKLEFVRYENVFMTFIINLEKETVTRVYKIGSDQYRYDYKIVLSNSQYLVGFEKFTPDWVSLVTINLEKKAVNTTYSGYGGTKNTFSVGQCA